MPDVHAVLTGDLVRSSALSRAELDGAMAALAEAAEAAAGWTGGTARFTRFRGDGWQCLAPSSRLALRAALVLKARLRTTGRGRDSRIAIGIGSAELVPGGDLAVATGPAFALAGERLDRMPRGTRLAVAWQEPPPGAALAEAVVALCDTLARRWTPAQAGVLQHLLVPEHPTQAAVAAGLGISQQMVAKHRLTAGADAIERALAACEAAVPHD